MGNVFRYPSDMFTSIKHFRQPNQQTCYSSSAQDTPPDELPNETARATSTTTSMRSDSALRYKTPVGPIRLDFSWNLNPTVYPVLLRLHDQPPACRQSRPLQLLLQHRTGVLSGDEQSSQGRRLDANKHGSCPCSRCSACLMASGSSAVAQSANSLRRTQPTPMPATTSQPQIPPPATAPSAPPPATPSMMPRVPGTQLDRVVAIVNEDLILDSDVNEELRLQAFDPYRPGLELSPTRAIERLINRALDSSAAEAATTGTTL